MYYNNLLVKSIYNFIKFKHPLLFKSYDFHYHTQKYDLKIIIEACLFFIKISSSWKNFKYNNINYNTIYKNFIKLNKFNIFSNTYAMLLNKYLKKGLNKKIKLIYSDTTTIYNKLNSDTAKINKYFKNKKVIKISLITDTNGITIDADLQSGNKHDSLILFNELDKLKNKEYYKDSIFIADSGYDSPEFVRC